MRMQSACRSHAFGVDDTEKQTSRTCVRDDALYILPLQMLFLTWSTSGEYKWITLP